MLTQSPKSPEPVDSNSSESTTTTHAESTERIKAWSELISSIANFLKSLAPWLWGAVVILVIIPLIGQAILAHSFNQSTQPTPSKTDQTITVNPIDWNKVDKVVQEVLQTAHQNAKNYANQELNLWVDDLMEKVDPNFLDWYFGYFHQKQIEYKSFFTGVTTAISNKVLPSSLNPNSLSPEEKVAEEITQDFQMEFAKRVLRPQISQLQLQRVTNETVKNYLNEVSQNLKLIPVKYSVPQGDWNQYLNDVAVTIYDTEGHLSTFSLKVFAGGGAYFAVKPIVTPILPIVSSKVVAKLAGKAGAKLATKTGGMVAGKIGSALLDTTVGVGIILWDIWDTNHTANIERPILRENLQDYLNEVKESLLNNPETGVMVAVDSIQQTLLQGNQELSPQ